MSLEKRLNEVSIILRAKAVNALWVDMQRRILNPAKDRGVGHCVRCGWCCAKRTCGVTPEEVIRISNYLGMSTFKFIRTYMVGDMTPEDQIPYLRFANTAQKHLVGRFLPVLDTYATGQCIMYDISKKECRIYVVAPKEAKDYKCWQEKRNFFRACLEWKQGQLEKIAPWMIITYGK